MRRTLAILAIIVPLLALRFPLGAPAHALNLSATVSASSTGNGTDYFTIYVSYLGFNGTSGNLTLPATQGDAVTIKFVWNDSSLGFDNAHQLEVEGYGVKSAVIDQESKVSIIQFTASMTGTFQIHCIIPCEGMEAMQNGWLVVHSAQGSGAVTASTTSTSTTSTVTTTTTSATVSSTTSTRTTSSSTVVQESTLATHQSLSLSLYNGGLLVSVRLDDSNGNSIVGASILFSVQTDFGMMSLGSSTTDSNGDANFTTDSLPAGWSGVYSSFSGSENYEASKASIALDAKALDPSPSDSGSPYVSGQATSLDPRLVGVPPVPAGAVVSVFLLVLISVYLVFAFVLIRVFGIRRKPRVGQE